MALCVNRGRASALCLVASLWLCAPSVYSQDADASFEQAEQNVPWEDLMVNLPEAEMDALAADYLQKSLQQSAQQAQPAPVYQAPAAVYQPPAAPKARHSGPSKLDFNEVVLSRSEWLSDITQQSDAALANNNWPLAELRLAQALGEFPDAHDTRLRLAAMLYGRGALGQTRAVLQQGIELAPQHADFRLTLARILAEQQRFDAALQQLEQANPSLSEHLDYYSLKAEMARRSGQCPQAIVTYQQLLSQAQAGAWWLGLGLCQRELGQDFSSAFLQARASADLGEASQRFVEQQLKQLTQRGQDGQTQTN